MTNLSDRTLGRLPDPVARPRYDRAALRAGIVHFGVGNFHRTHLALYVDDCLALPGQEAWGIVGVGLTDGPAARAKAEAYRQQDGLYTVSEFTPDGRGRTRVIGAMIDYLHAPADPEAVLARLAHPDTRIVSLTITEGGYNIDEATGAFALDTPDVAHDLAGGPPRSAFGFVVEALARRRATGLGGFTVCSCDNLRGNGDTARKAFTAFARARDPGLADWIDAEVDFPNAMVDRIAPQVPAEVRDGLNRRSGIDDRLPAMAESFNQWVTEDRFRQGRPRLEEAGVEFRDDVADFVAVKGRMLNAAHMMMCWPSLLMGHRLVHAAMGDRRIVALIEAFLDRDVIPHVSPPPGLSPDKYRAMVVERFSNPAIADQLLRVASDGASKLPIFHARTLSTLIGAGADLGREAFMLACYARCLLGRDDAGATFEVVEPVLKPDDWALIRTGPAGILRASPFAALDLGAHRPFMAAFESAAASIAERGASATLDDVLAGA